MSAVKTVFAPGMFVRCTEHVGDDRALPGSEVRPEEIGIVVTIKRIGENVILGSLCVGSRLRHDVLFRGDNGFTAFVECTKTSTSGVVRCTLGVTLDRVDSLLHAAHTRTRGPQ
jgi:hypothetical protein